MDRLLSATRGGQTFNLSYDAENRMTGVTGAAAANFVYDDTGARVIATEGVTTTVYVGSYFEWHGTITDTVKYYYAGTVRVAMRKGDGQPLFLLGDHLGSTNRLVHADGTPVTPGGMRLYKAWGESRYEPDGELATEYRYTGQFEQQTIGLYYYRARWYDAYLNRWCQPDNIIPDINDPQSYDRFSYVRNNPVKYIDPTGHDLEQLYYDKHEELPISVILEDGKDYREYYYKNPEEYIWKLLNGSYDYTMFSAEAYSDLTLHQPFLPLAGDQYGVAAQALQRLANSVKNGGAWDPADVLTLLGVIYSSTGGGEFNTFFPRGSGASTGPVPRGYTQVSRWVSVEEALLWMENGGTTVPGGVGTLALDGTQRVYVTLPGAAQPGGTGPVRIDFYIPSGVLQPAGNSLWRQIVQPLQNVPIYNVRINFFGP